MVDSDAAEGVATQLPSQVHPKLRQASTWCSDMRDYLSTYRELIYHIGVLSPTTRVALIRSVCRDFILNSKLDSRLRMIFIILATIKFAVWLGLPLAARHTSWHLAQTSSIIWIYGYYLAASLAQWYWLRRVAYGNLPKQMVANTYLGCIVLWYNLYGSNLIKPYLKGSLLSFLNAFPKDNEQIVATSLSTGAFFAATVLAALVSVLTRTVLEPLVLRQVGSVPPPNAAALIILRILWDMYFTGEWWRQASGRRWLAKRFRLREREAESALVFATRGCGGLRDDLKEARLRAWHLKMTLRHYRQRLVDVYSYDDCRTMVDSLAAEMSALVGGDWSKIYQNHEPVLRSKLQTLAHRAVAPVLLLAVAIGLNYMPGITVPTPGLRSIQVGLLATAFLALVSVDSNTTSSILSALRDAMKRSGLH